MARKKKEEVEIFEEIQLPYDIEPTPTPEVKPTHDNSLVMKVENLRAKGFDDNRIAATLMIHKHIVESI